MIENASRGQTAAGHDIVLKDRAHMQIHGVKEIVSFDENAIVLTTVCGDMSVEGEGLHVSVLNVENGTVELDGRVNSIYYYDASPRSERSGLFARLFRQ